MTEGVSTLELEREQETSFGGGKTQSTRLSESFVEELYLELSEETGQIPEAFHFDDFDLRDEKLYYKDNRSPHKQNKLRSVPAIAQILCEDGLRYLGFDISRGKVTAQQAIMLNRVEEELPSTSNLAKADGIELQEITKNTARSMDNLIEQLEGLPQGQEIPGSHLY